MSATLYASGANIVPARTVASLHPPALNPIQSHHVKFDIPSFNNNTKQYKESVLGIYQYQFQ